MSLLSQIVLAGVIWAVGVASLEPGQSIKCGAAEGCIVLTKRAMHQLLSELAAEANKSCKKAGWV